MEIEFLRNGLLPDGSESMNVCDPDVPGQ